MKTKYNYYVPTKMMMTISAIIFIGISSCSDKEEIKIIDNDEKELILPADSSLFYKVIRVSNLKVNMDENDYTSSSNNVFYSLERNMLVENKYKQTRLWDLAFGNIQNSFLSGNNGKDPLNLGYNNSAIGGITIVEKAFQDVMDIPEDKAFDTRKEIIGPDINGDHAIGDLGWFIYDFYGSIVRNGKYEDEHIAYPLSEPLKLKNGKTVSPRTIILRTAAGNYAKLKMISCYKDQLKSEEWKRNSPKVYMTFEFVLAPKGSKKFIIK